MLSIIAVYVSIYGYVSVSVADTVSVDGYVVVSVSVSVHLYIRLTDICYLVCLSGTSTCVAVDVEQMHKVRTDSACIGRPGCLSPVATLNRTEPQAELRCSGPQKFCIYLQTVSFGVKMAH